jgi:hypothetical protein
VFCSARVRGLAAILGLLALAGCSSPASGDDTLAAGRERVEALVADAAATLPSTVEPQKPFASGSVACRRKFLGYATGTTGRRRAEAPILVPVPDGISPRSLLDPIEAHWQEEGFTIDRDGLSDERYPKIRATTPDGYEIVATAIMYGPTRVDLYAVSQCLQDS